MTGDRLAEFEEELRTYLQQMPVTQANLRPRVEALAADAQALRVRLVARPTQDRRKVSHWPREAALHDVPAVILTDDDGT